VRASSDRAEHPVLDNYVYAHESDLRDGCWAKPRSLPMPHISLLDGPGDWHGFAVSGLEFGSGEGNRDEEIAERGGVREVAVRRAGCAKTWWPAEPAPHLENAWVEAEEDFHLQAIERARHREKRRGCWPRRRECLRFVAQLD